MIGPATQYYDNGNVSQIIIHPATTYEKIIKFDKDGSTKYEINVLEKTNKDNWKAKVIGYYPKYKKHFDVVLNVSPKGFNIVEGHIWNKRGVKREANIQEVMNILKW